MINYEYNDKKSRWEFMFLTPDKKQVSLGYLIPTMPEDQKMKLLVNWFNACLRQLNEEASPSQPA